MDIMSMLEARQLDKVRERFERRPTGGQTPDGLSLEEFCEIILENVPSKYTSTETDRLALISDLLELHEQIDVNGDTRITWIEFSKYCIECGATALSLAVSFSKARLFLH